MKRLLSVFLTGALILQTSGIGAPSTLASVRRPPEDALQQLLAKSYIELFEQASQTTISKVSLEAWRKQIEAEKKREEEALKKKGRL